MPDQREMFVCPECGPRVKADEDGCCATCGQDCDVVPYGHLVITVSGGCSMNTEELFEKLLKLLRAEGFGKVQWVTPEPMPLCYDGFISEETVIIRGKGMQ